MREREIVIRLRLPASPGKRWLVGGTLATLCLSAVVYAAFPAPPYPVPAFASGESLSSSKLSGFINGLDSRVMALEGVRTLRATITACSGGGCTVNAPGAWIQPAVNVNSNGNYTIAFAAGTFSGPPICTTGILNAIGYVDMNSVTASGIANIYTYSTSATQNFGIDFSLICVGPK